MERYSEIPTKNPREIVLLRGSGCKWRRCRFCNYHLDFSTDTAENYSLNKAVLDNVSGKYKTLEVINSGSFCDLDTSTMSYILKKCLAKGIKQLHFECHWLDRSAIADMRTYFEQNGITVKTKIGVETFDSLFRESYLVKGIDTDNPEDIAKYFNEVCLLQGIAGQTEESMLNDIETGLKYFDRVCINIMVENGMPVRPDNRVIDIFKSKIYPRYIQNPRVDILLDNTDFGVGGESNE